MNGVRMKRFFKDNLVLLIVLGAAALASLALLVLVVIEHSQMYGYFQQAEGLQKQISSLVEQEPAPVEGNVKPIEETAALYREKTEELRQYFGSVKGPALDAFAAALGVKLPEFLEDFRKAWEEDASRTALGGRDRFYQRFRQRYKNWGAALDAFQKEYQKVSAEPITAANVDEVLMTALGLQRSMDNSPEKCLRYMWGMRSRMTELFADGKVELQGDATSFGFDYKQPPAPEAIPDIARSWQAVGDLASRIARSGADALYSFHIRKLGGERDGDYVVHHFTFGVAADLNKVRSLVKSLHAASAQHRMYVVRSVFLYADNDGAQNVFYERAAEAEQARLSLSGSAQDQQNQPQAQASGPAPGLAPAPGVPPFAADPASASGAGAAQQQVKTPEQIREEIMSMPYDKRPGYGRKLFGGSSKCEAVLDVEYVALAEPELK